MDRNGEFEDGALSVPSRLAKSPHIPTRQYARIVHQRVAAIGLDSTVYGTHSMRRTKATLMYKRTKNLRAVQLLLGHTKLESTVRYLGIEVDDALEILSRLRCDRMVVAARRRHAQVRAAAFGHEAERAQPADSVEKLQASRLEKLEPSRQFR